MLMALGKGFQKRKSSTSNFLIIILIVLIFFPAASLPVSAAPDLLDRIQDEDLEQVIRLRVGRSKVLRTPFPIQRRFGG